MLVNLHIHLLDVHLRSIYGCIQTYLDLSVWRDGCVQCLWRLYGDLLLYDGLEWSRPSRRRCRLLPFKVLEQCLQSALPLLKTGFIVVCAFHLLPLRLQHLLLLLFGIILERCPETLLLLLYSLAAVTWCSMHILTFRVYKFIFILA